MYMCHHIIRLVFNNIIETSHCIFKELSDGLICALCMFGFLFCDCVECCEYGEAYRLRIVKYCSNNQLAIFYSILVKFRGGVIIWHILYSGAILRSSTLTRNILLVKG